MDEQRLLNVLEDLSSGVKRIESDVAELKVSEERKKAKQQIQEMQKKIDLHDLLIADNMREIALLKQKLMASIC